MKIKIPMGQERKSTKAFAICRKDEVKMKKKDGKTFKFGYEIFTKIIS